MRYPTLALACLLAVTGCQVIALGDSNTCEQTTGCGDGGANWLGYLTLPALWTAENDGVPGLEAADAMPRLEAILAAHPCGRLMPASLRARMVIALGTNDLVHPGWSGVQVAQAVLALYDRARQVPCLTVYVATIPPRLDVNEGIRISANATIYTRVPADRLIPFGDQPAYELNNSGVHFTDAGQHHRAEIAHRVLFGG